ncbi:ABC transporter ATP-binding protein [Arthrobacter sp. A5]|uniref:ABC transporter ATP-binding protein n=1 Tax=Arthrobacter sp. A5 TaxID=576926 RepID=UPI003DAA3D33
MRLVIADFRYPGEDKPALRGIDLSIEPGNCVLVAGGSGSGKSTLARILAGVLPGRNGGTLNARFEVAGENLVFSAATATPDGVNPRINPAVWNRQLAYVGQDPAAQLSTVAQTVAEEIAFALENAGMEQTLMVRRVHDTAAALGLEGLLHRSPAELSGGELRRVIIAGAVALHPAVLVLDEPTAGLDAVARRAVESLVASMLARGTGIVLLSPETGGIGRLAGRIVLLDGGRQVANGPRSTVLASAEAVRLPVLEDPLDSPPEDRVASVAGVADADTGLADAETGHVDTVAASVIGYRPAVDVRGVVFSHNGASRPRAGWFRRFRRARRVDVGTRAAADTAMLALDNVDLRILPGEVVAIAGANGAGKSSLLRHLNGLARPRTGSVHILGADIARRPVGEVAAQVGFLFQDPHDQLFERSVAREVAFGLSGAGVGHADADADDGGGNRMDAANGKRAADSGTVRDVLERCGLSGVAQEHPYELPASAQRLVSLATVLARRPSVLALDEPTVAMDRDGLRRLADAIRAEAAGGAAVVVVTHDLDFAYRHCGRLVLLAAGRIVDDGPISEVLDRHFSTGEAFGVEAPAAWLRRRNSRS